MITYVIFSNAHTDFGHNIICKNYKISLEPLMIMLWFYWKCPLPRPSCQFCCSICFDKVCRIWCFLFDYTILYWQIKYIFQDFCCWFLRIRKIVWGRGVGRDIFSIGGMGGSSALIKVVVLNTSQQWPPIPRTMSNKIEIRFSYTIWLFWSYYRRNFSEKISEKSVD